MLTYEIVTFMVFNFLKKLLLRTLHFGKLKKGMRTFGR